MAPQPKRLNQEHSASAPTLSGHPINPADPDADVPPGWAKTDCSGMRPGRRQLPVTGNSAGFGQTASNALYGTPSYSSLYVEPEDLEPGPGTYDIPSANANQAESGRRSGASVTLAAKHDKAWSKVMITKDHNEMFKARDTPGPGTYKPALVATQARIRFGTGKRKPMCETNFRAPGPVYETRGNPDNPESHTKFGKADRFSGGQTLANQLSCAGPGQYEVPTAFEGGRLAKSFGASHRAYDSVRFPGSERTFVGKASPGPGAMKPLYNDSVRMSFGRAERLPADHSAKRAPGPGAYDAHDRPYPFSRNQSCYSFGRPHASGRLDWKQIKGSTNSVWGYK